MTTSYKTVPIGNTPEHWEAIEWNYHIYAASQTKRIAVGLFPPPSFFDREHFTPIEWDVWTVFREMGIDFLPQYPCIGYYLDFANPEKRVAIECDGKDWHSSEKAKARDAKRDAALAAAGWSIYRIKGSECVRWTQDPYETASEVDPMSGEGRFHLEKWMLKTPEGIVSVICERHFGRSFLASLREMYGESTVDFAASRIAAPTPTGYSKKAMWAALAPNEDLLKFDASIRSAAEEVRRIRLEMEGKGNGETV